ncbi:galactokinase [Pseudocyphellaria aurata]|nr:galactokinase [Pseudocyphellaria aurata]
MDEFVPVDSSFESLYAPEALEIQKQRWNRLVDVFKETYENQSPTFVARSPGRVNIIGEHIDYSLYEVLPMAIAADVLIAVSHSPQIASDQGANISIANIDPKKFPSADFVVPNNGDVEIDASTHDWTNYFKAGLRGAIGFLRKDFPDFSPSKMQILVDGNVPAGGGLSSSAAFVCASALAVLRSNQVEHVSKKELVELAIVSERAVGVNSGGMDQAASVFSIKGDALSVSFSPKLHAEAVAFPNLDPPITFMIAQSFVAADKHVTAPECYNLRVVECSLAADVMAAALKLNLPGDASPLKRSLRGLQTAYFNAIGEDVAPKEQLQKMLALVREVLPKTQGYTLEDIASLLSLPASTLWKNITAEFPIRASRFRLAERATHVFSEALRVLEFKSLLRQYPHQQTPSEPTSNLLTRLGALMNSTQSSCRDDYDCSCPELDHLCAIARDAGAYGSRLTGAGWGGCSVHLVPKDRVDAVRAAWVERYYRVREPGISAERLKEAVVISEPGPGSMM